MPDKQYILEVKDLSIEYMLGRRSGKAVTNVNFGIKKGEIFGLAGESGCGKSTLAWSILRLLPKSARFRTGQILFEGSNLLEMPEKRLDRDIRGNKISIIIQNVKDSLNPVFTVGSQMSDLLRFHEQGPWGGGPQYVPGIFESAARKRKRRETSVRMLKEMEIASPKRRYRSYPHQFSGGMKQRVMMAMGLMSRPSLLIADEPTTGLDVSVERYIVELFKRKIRNYDTSVLYITHDLRVLSELSDRVAIMYAGKIVETGPSEHIFSQPRHPYTQALIQCLPEKGAFGKKLREIDGRVPSIFERDDTCNFYSRCSRRLDICENGPPDYARISPQHFSLCHHGRGT